MSCMKELYAGCISVTFFLFQQVLVSRFYRDMRLISIGGGADEVMLSIICKYMGILPKLGKK